MCGSELTILWGKHRLLIEYGIRFLTHWHKSRAYDDTVQVVPANHNFSKLCGQVPWIGKSPGSVVGRLMVNSP